MLDFIEEIKNDPEFMYNLINMLFLPVFGGKPLYKAYNCGEFIAKVLETAGIPLHMPYHKYMPKYMDELLTEYEIFEGTLENKGEIPPGDDFFAKTPFPEYFITSCRILKELIYRQMFKRASKGYSKEKMRLKKKA